MAYAGGYADGYGSATARVAGSPSGRSTLLPRVHWTLDGYEIPLDDWLASTVANGGYDSFRGVIPERYVRRNPSFTQGALLTGIDETGAPVWEGRQIVNPIIRNGVASIAAVGNKAVADKHAGRLLFQAAGTEQWAEQDASPHASNSAASLIAQENRGMFKFRVVKGESLVGDDTVGFVFAAQGQQIRYFRANVQATGSGGMQNVALRLYRASYPNGARTLVTSTTSSGSISANLSANPADMIILVAQATATQTASASATYTVRDVRVNGLISEDSAEVHKVVKVVGQKCGYDVSGIQTGIPIRHIRPETWTRRYKFPQGSTTMDRFEMVRSGEWKNLPTVDTVQRAVVSSALNILPLDWQSGPWSGLLDYLAEVLDWRWRVLGDTFGGGAVLQFGPWADVWNVALANVELTPQEMFNEVVVKYPNAAGIVQEVRHRADPDPLARHGVINVYEHQIQDVQVDDGTAREVAANLAQRYSTPRYSGTIEITNATDISMSGSAYSVLAGDLLEVSDLGLGPQRVFQTEMTPRSVKVGIEQPVSLSASLALRSRGEARQMKPVFRHMAPITSVGKGGKLFVRE
jgi:cytochrome c5